MSAHRSVGKALLVVVLTVGAVLIVWPIIWMFLAVFKTTEEILRVPPQLFPSHLNMANFRELFALYPFFRSYLNSIIVTVLGSVLFLLTSALCGYIFGKFQFRGSRLFFLMVLATFMVPVEMKIIPLFLVVKAFGLVNTYLGIIAPGIVGAFGIFLMRQFVQSLPNDYLDAARVDGVSEYGIFARVAMPLMVPGLSVLAIIAVLSSWESFLWPLIAINSSTMRTLPLLLSTISYKGSRYDLILSGAALAALPPLVVFFVFQRQFVRVAALSGLK